MMFDTHTHLYLPEFDPDKDAAVRRAIEAGVTMMMMPNVDLSTIAPMRELAARWPANVIMAMGLHPTSVGSDREAALDAVISELEAHRTDYHAIGEVGMDLYWDKTFRDGQREVFARQLDVARIHGLPVIIHCREALDDTLDVLTAHSPGTPVIFHSFTGTPGDVDRIRRTVDDAWFGINGVVTFKNTTLRETLPAIGLDRILTETDSPYLAPVPHRGKRNESSFIPLVVKQISDSLGIPAEEVRTVTAGNACRVFGIDAATAAGA